MKQYLNKIITIVLLSITAYSLQANDRSSEPIITIQTNIYNEYGDSNIFTIYLGSTEITRVSVDCGFGPKEYDVTIAAFDSSTNAIKATGIPCTVSSEGIVKIYGDPLLIDYLTAIGCSITSIDCRQLVNLDIIDLSYNELDGLDLTPFTRLRSITVTGNEFSNSPLIIGPGKPELAILEMNYVQQLDPAFDLKEYPSLVSFSAWSAWGLKSVDPSGCPMLQQLSIDSTPVETLDLSNNASLRILNISDTRISSVDLSHNPLLYELYCTNMSGSINTDKCLSELDLSHNPELVYLYAGGNSINSIDLSGNPKLFKLSIHNNRLTSLDLSHNKDLYEVSIYNNYMNFATLPADPGTWFDYQYEQHDLEIAHSYKEGDTIDFSQQVLREGSETYAQIYTYPAVNPNNSEPLDPSYYTYENGILTLLKATPDSVYVSFTNSALPAYPLNTTLFRVKTETDYGKPDMALSFTTSIADGQPVSFSIGMAGATASSPAEFYVDFGDGNLKTYLTTDNGMPTSHNVNGYKAGYGSVSVYIPEGGNITAFGTDDMPMYSVNLTALSALRHLRLTNAGLYTVDLSYNRRLTTLDLSHNNLSTFSLAGINDLYQKTLLTDIDVSYNNLSEMEIPDDFGIRRLDISHNRFTDITVDEAENMVEFNAAHNEFEFINLLYCTSLKHLDLSHNRLTSIIMPQDNNVTHLAVNDNSFTLANMPVAGGHAYESFIYAPQSTIEIPTKGPGINLSDQYINIDGRYTQFVWKKADGTSLVDGTDYTVSEGNTRFINTSVGFIYCEMTHPAYPDLSGENALRTTLIEAAGMPEHRLATFETTEDGETVSLVLTARSGNPAVYIDWSGNDNLTQYLTKSSGPTIYEATTKAGATVNVYTYSEDETLTVFSITGASMKSLDVSPLTSLIALTAQDAGLEEITWPESADLAEINLQGNKFTKFDMARYPKLYSLSLNGNCLTSVDLSPAKNLQLFDGAGNDISTVTLDNPQLWMLSLNNNDITEIDLSKVPEMEQLGLYSNRLSHIDVDKMPKLKALILDNNRFDFTTLPPIKSSYIIYTYTNQAPADVTPVDGKVDLSRYASVNGTATEYTWYLGVPEPNEDGVLEGETLYIDDEYSIDNGITTFHTPFSGVMCVMTNSEFPKLAMYTNLMDVTAAGVDEISADTAVVSVSVIGNDVYIKAPAGLPVALHDISGKTIRRAITDDNDTVLNDIQTGVYIISVGHHTCKLAVR